MNLVLLKGPVPDDHAQALDHLQPIDHRSNQKYLHRLPNYLRVRKLLQELFESRVGVRAAQLRIEVHDTVRGILRESTEPSQPRVGFFLQALALADVTRHDHPQRLPAILDHANRNLDRNDTTAACQQSHFRRVLFADAPASAFPTSRVPRARILHADGGRTRVQQFLTGKPKDPAGSLIYIEETKLPVEHIHQV